MRTTLTIETAAFEYVQAYADAKALKLGEAVSELIQKARAAVMAEATNLTTPATRSGMRFVPMEGADGLWVFDAPPNTSKMTAEEVRRLIEKTEQEEDDRIIAMSQRPKRRAAKSKVAKSVAVR